MLSSMLSWPLDSFEESCKEAERRRELSRFTDCFENESYMSKSSDMEDVELRSSGLLRVERPETLAGDDGDKVSVGNLVLKLDGF